MIRWWWRFQAHVVLSVGRARSARRRWRRYFKRCPDCGGRTARAWNHWGNEGRACLRAPLVHAFVAKRKLPLLGPGITIELVQGFTGRPPEPADEPDELEFL